MTVLRGPGWLAPLTAAIALALICALPAGALAETPPESEPSPPAEASPPTSPGWVPPSETAEDTGSSTAPIRRGSSLGSGGGPSQPAPADQEPAPSEEPAPAPASSGTYKPEAPSQSIDQEPASAPEPLEPAPAVDPEPRVAKPDPVALGAAVAVARASEPESPSVAPVQAKPVADLSEQAAAGPSGLLWPVVIVGILLLLYVGARLLLGPVELDLFRSNPFRRRRGYPRF